MKCDSHMFSLDNHISFNVSDRDTRLPGVAREYASDIRSMADYESEPELHDAFELMLRLYDFNSQHPRLAGAFSATDFFTLYRDFGIPNWIHLYEQEMDALLYYIGELVRKTPLSAEQLQKLDVSLNGQGLEKFLTYLLEHVNDSTSVQDEASRLKSIPYMLFARCVWMRFVCLIQFKEDTTTLIDLARGGNHDAFNKLVKLDSIFLTTDYARRILQEAEICLFDSFKEELGKALKPNPNFWRLKGKRDYYALLCLSKLGNYSSRTDKEWSDFLAKHEFDNYCDPGNVRRARGRYNIPKIPQD
ncbi:MAG: hypothetical protein ABIK83_05170 [Candidatus Zixiibacteriota bacterium]